MRPTRFILIDDDSINNYICKRLIKKTFPFVEVVDFIHPEEGLKYIQSLSNTGGESCSMLLLDINMPEMSGWEFIEKYSHLDATIRDQVHIYMLSSSVDSRDRDKADRNKFVNGYYEKPLSAANLVALCDVYAIAC
jgi:response regulator RpfG family c-di-GMP phosphodiesterase